jgi:hypothetical protein
MIYAIWFLCGILTAWLVGLKEDGVLSYLPSLIFAPFIILGGPVSLVLWIFMRLADR